MANGRRAGIETQRSFRQAARRISRLARHMKGETGALVFGIGNEIMTDVLSTRMGKGVPRELGNLADTGKVFGPTSNAEVRLVFGGTAAPYALVQHERLDYRHPRGGEARYLVRGVERWEPNGSQAMRAIRENTEAGIRAIRRRAA